MKRLFFLFCFFGAQNCFAQELAWVRDDRVLNRSGVQSRGLPAQAGNARIDLGDVDGDGYLDLVMLDNEGLQFYRNRSSSNFDQFERRPDWEIGIDLSGVEYNTIPTLADLNYDLHPELIIPDPTIRVWRNVGFAGNIIWFRDDAMLDGIAGRQIVAVVDLYNDAAFDIVTRCSDTSDDCIYRNIGAPSQAAWQLLPTTLRDVIDPAAAETIGNFQSIRFADVDNDGDEDLFVTETVPIAFAYLFVLENTTSSGNLFFRNFRPPVSFNGLEGMNPALGDLDKNGTIDFVAGDRSYFLAFYKNSGTPVVLNFDNPVLWGAPRAFLETDPAIGDLDGDNDPDLILAGAMEPTDIAPPLSQIDFFRNTGDAQSFHWEEKETIFVEFGYGHLRATVDFNDFNNDGELDIAVGSHLVEGDVFDNTSVATAISFFKKIPGGLSPVWEEDSSVFAQFANDSIYYDPILFDFNRDAALDLLVQVAGEYAFYENVGTQASPIWEVRPQWLEGLEPRQHNRAAVGDANKDGLPDLLFGELNGTVNFYQNIGATSMPRWLLNNSAFFTIAVDSSAAPAFGDLEGDTDLDLLIGDDEGRVVYYRNDLIVGVENNNENVPQSSSLRQNYPNPFNPETTIEYELAQAGQVRLTIYNLLGQRVRTLVDGWQPAGPHRASWDGRDERRAKSVSSGVYVYELKFWETVLRRKMVLLH